MWIKICGVTNVDDAEAIVDAGADAVGLNFFSRSKRFISADDANTICDAVNSKLDVVGVFVNSAADEVVDIVRHVQLTAVQFHGDETTASIAAVHEACPGTGIVRAFRLRAGGVVDVIQSIRELRQNGVPLAAVLVDAFVADEYGGTGHMVDAELFRDFRQQLSCLADAAGSSENRVSPLPRLILAGGLTPTTVVEAVNAVQPWGIDTASGVETRPGVKSSEKIRQFVHSVRTAMPSDPPKRL
ncbi:MAG: phosphoribosylanthranilate isomerase [Fuerstiella sp.]|nr:phosphoribosylanthranilate isomerase [Fuerstiella sp.]MCP4854314.1 phosphoribosylanthranilate isomerase [Fuerstiella sp.]